MYSVHETGSKILFERDFKTLELIFQTKSVDFPQVKVFGLSGVGTIQAQIW